MNNMRCLYIIVCVLVMCNIAVTGSTSFTIHSQWNGIWQTDTVDTVANASTLSVDTLSKDSAAVDTLSKDSAAVDTLVKDSAAVDTLARDSVAVDSLAKDSLAVDTLVKDSLAVDTLAKDSVAVDSFARFVVQPKKRVYVYFKEKPEPDSDQKKIEGFIALYKKNLANKTLESFEAAYLPWKGAFDGCSRRTLDMYMDGIGIILNLVRKDTLEHKYDKLTERREQLMELYDLAVDNLDELNSQIDRKRTPDTLSVAKLRAAQVRKYRECWILDSIFNGNDTLHNKYTKDNAEYWAEKLRGSDSASLDTKYRYYKDIVFSSDNNIYDYNTFAYFSKYLLRYASREVKRLQADSTKAASAYIMTHLKPEFDSIIEYTKKRFAEYEEVRKKVENTNFENMQKVAEGIETASYNITRGFSNTTRGPVDIDKLAEPYIARKEELGGGFNKEFAAEVKEESRLLKHWIYLEALQWWYNNEEATFDLAEEIVKSARAQKNYNVAAQYYEKMANDPMLFMEFDELNNVEKSEIHYMAALCYNVDNKDKNTAAKIDNLVEAIKITPQYYMAYQLMGEIMYNYAPKVNLPNWPKEIAGRVAYYHAYDKFNEALKAYKEVSANPEIYEGIKLNPEDEKRIKEYISSSYSRFLTKIQLHERGMSNWAGKSIPLSFVSKKNKFMAIIRTTN